MTAPDAASAGGPSGPRAEFWTRFGGAIIDLIVVGVVTAPLQLALDTAGQVLGAALGLAYYTYLEGSPSGQTLGKRAVGIRVIDLGGGGPIGFGRALIRYLGRIVSGIACLLGYFWMIWDKEKQTWHDKFANSVVVPTSSYPVAAWPG